MFHLILLITSSLNGATADPPRENTTVLEPEVEFSDWGEWGQASYCPGKAWVRSVSVKYQGDQGAGEVDDSGVNGLEFTCTDGSWGKGQLD